MLLLGTRTPCTATSLDILFLIRMCLSFHTTAFIFIMAQAVCEIHANATDSGLWSRENFLKACRSDATVDTKFIAPLTKRGMKRVLNHLTRTGRCRVTGCGFRSRRGGRQHAHGESHSLLLICVCGASSSSTDSTAVHTYIHPRVFCTPIIQVDQAHWAMVNKLVHGLPDGMPTLPVRLKSLD